jgi:hypothetical protein
MKTSRFGQGIVAIPVLMGFLMATTAPRLSAQNQDGLSALAPENLNAPRPDSPFDLTGAWLHSGNERFDPPEGFVLTPEAQVHYDAAAQATAEGRLYRNDIGLCWPAGMPIMMTRVWPVAMIQLPTAIYMIGELMNSLRVVYLDGREHTDPDLAIPSFNGESIGRWEGDTLVIDTTHFVDHHHWLHDRLGIPGSDALRIIERVRMLEEGNRLEIEYTLSDPKVFEGEWVMTKYWNRVNDRDIAEVECLPDLNDHMPTVQSDLNVRSLEELEQ